MKTPAAPSPAELEQLDTFLKSKRLGPEALRTHGIDGLVTAIVIGPDMVMPSQWMPRVWDYRDLKFKDEHVAERIIGFVMGLYQRVASLFADDTSDRFEPLYVRLSEGKEREKAIHDWCRGFMAGLALHPSMKDKESREPLLEFIWPMAAMTGGGKLATPAVIETIVPSVRSLHAIWLKGRRAVVPGPARGMGAARGVGQPAPAAPGRNDPCPCGSGLKFKKCCGGPGGTVH
ncbi:MAG TPA: UPF0149 family protein [Candidatus Eisenbacteria bacterium]